MSKSGSRYGRRSNWFKIHCLLSAQSQNGGMNSTSEANNNNSSATNNNNPPGGFPPNSLGKSPIPSTVTSLGSLSGSSGEDREMRDRSERERTPSSSASRNGSSSNGLPPAFSSFAAGLSPESREQFLASLNRKFANPELADYLRAAGVAGIGMPGHSGFPMPGGKHIMERDDDRGEDMSRTTTTRSPGSLESPNSEASDENKMTNSLFTMPAGSPLEVKPNDLLPFDFLTKMGYDPLRLWPAMLTAAPHSLHQFNLNPYRFMFPGAFPGAFPGSYPPNAAAPSIPSPLLNGAMHPSKLLSAAAGIPEGLTSPIANLPNNMSGTGGDGGRSSTSMNSGQQPTTPTSNHGSPNHSIRNRVTPVVPPSSSLTLTPPISHHSSDEPVVGLPVHKVRGAPTQDKPIDLSAKSTNNNYVDDDYQTKKFIRLNGALSPTESDSEDEHDNMKRGDLRHHHHFLHHQMNSDREYDSEADNEPQPLIKSEINRNSDDDERVDSDRDEDDDAVGVVAEDLRSSNNNNELLKPGTRRRSSSGSRDVRSPKRERVSTPLDLTRSTSSTPVAPPKIAT